MNTLKGSASNSINLGFVTCTVYGHLAPAGVSRHTSRSDVMMVDLRGRHMYSNHPTELEAFNRADVDLSDAEWYGTI